MKHKYSPDITGAKQKGDGRQGRYVDPSKWCMGPDPVTREKYYAFLKHRAQANFRGEDYTLTWEDWETLWDHDTFAKRGRRAEDLCLSRLDYEDGWHIHNVEIMTRMDYLSKKRQAEYIRNGR